MFLVLVEKIMKYIQTHRHKTYRFNTMAPPKSIISGCCAIINIIKCVVLTRLDNDIIPHQHPHTSRIETRVVVLSHILAFTHIVYTILCLAPFIGFFLIAKQHQPCGYHILFYSFILFSRWISFECSKSKNQEIGFEPTTSGLLFRRSPN